jgi:hypothetical protein
MSRILALMAVVSTVFGGATASAADSFAVQTTDDRVTVTLDGQLFTEYVFKGHSKPIFYPVLGPGGAMMTRHWPMKERVPHEATDHPHQKSMWFTHGAVNGVDFWAEYPPKNKPEAQYGRQVQQSITAQGGSQAVIRAENLWLAPDGKPVLSDARTITFSADGSSRILDFQITLKADHGEVTMQETKEGTMGIRTNPALDLTSKDKNRKATGQAINSEGVSGKDVWGKNARWVDYWGPIDGKTVGIAIFDHPSNPRHPTGWHARDYGLIAANPFGGADYDKSLPKGTGDMKIPAGESITLKYRFIFHEGDVHAAKIADAYARWIAP